MDYETLFTATKWDIISALSKESLSPLQLAKVGSTSIANVSQQLRLLEMANLVEKKRLPNRDKGQPRIVYSIKKDITFVILAGKNIAEKKYLDLSMRQKAIMRIWCLPTKSAHAALETAIADIEADLPKIPLIMTDGVTHIYIVTDDVSQKKKYSTLQVKGAKILVIGKEEAKKRNDFFVIHENVEGLK